MFQASRSSGSVMSSFLQRWRLALAAALLLAPPAFGRPLAADPAPADLAVEAAPAADAPPAQEAAKTAPRPAPRDYAGRAAAPPMWRIADADTELFLLGTFHILPPGLDWRSQALAAALDQADAVWFEAEVDTPAAHAEAIRTLKEAGRNPQGVTLSSLLEREDSAKLAEVAEELGLPAAALEPMRPWQAFLTLGVQFILSQGFDPGSGLETKLLAEARARGREIRFLETVGEQLTMFSTLPSKVERDLLTLTLREWERQSAEFGALFEAWLAGDSASIDALMNQAMRGDAPEVYDVLLTRRNQKWAKAIESALAAPGTAVIAVGAGHLAGPDSVPALLEARGVAVERWGLPAAANDNSED